MENQLDNFKTIIKAKDNLKILQQLLKYPLRGWISEYFRRTRNFDSELQFVYFCRNIINHEKDKLSDKQWKKYQHILILYELDAYDYMNDFDNYIALFNYALKNLSYTYTYVKSRNDEQFNKYVLYEDINFKYVHFLYLADKRYHIILRKKSKKNKGKLSKTILRHQQEELNDEELDNRYEELYRLLINIFKEFNKRN